MESEDLMPARPSRGRLTSVVREGGVELPWGDKRRDAYKGSELRAFLWRRLRPLVRRHRDTLVCAGCGITPSITSPAWARWWQLVSERMPGSTRLFVLAGRRPG